MAIQEVEKRETQGTQGRKRVINAAAEGLVMDIVQEQQYTKPIESTVRELTANAVDSQSEKERATEILSGQASADKYFIERDGALYADSKWNPSYYDFDHLDSANNRVELYYKEGTAAGRSDTFVVKDYGVGIGGRRLEGVLEVGFSTKRNRKDALGAFGLGAKVGLATGADFYTLTTVYNGVKYQLKVYRRKINSMIGALNLDTGEQNIPYTFSDGFTIYGEKTDEKNYSMVEVPALKHHKSNYIEAVKTQLLYFGNVDFYLVDAEGRQSRVNFAADTMYNSENLIISRNSPYSKPHVVIVKGGDDMEKQTGVCYGHIDFKEMELEDMSGDIGIKCPIRQVMEDEDGNEIVINEGVDVVPSREAVRWTAATRAFLKQQFEAAQDESTKLVEKELQQTDFLKWLEACKNLTQYRNRDTALGRLSQIVEVENLKPRFSKTRISFDSLTALFTGFKLITSTKFLDKDNKYKVTREDAKAWHSVQLNALYFKEENAKRYTDVYVADQHSGTFTTISPKSDAELNTEADVLIASGKLLSKNKLSWIESRKERRDEIIKLIASSENYKNYDDIEVPEDYVKSLTKIETKVEETEETKPVLSAAEKRELEQRVVCNTFVARYFSWNTQEGQTYIKSKREPKFQEVKDYKGKLYYGFKDDETKLQFACHLLDHHTKNDPLYRAGRNNHRIKEDHFYNDEYRIVMISKSNKKHFADHSHIDDFFGKAELVQDDSGKVTGCNIVMDNAVVQWYTARKMAASMKDLLFMENFDRFEKNVSEDYKELKTYVKRYHNDLTGYAKRFGMDKHYLDFVKFLERIEKLQEMVEQGESAEDIVEYVKESSLPGGVTGGLAVNREKLDKIEELLAYAGPVKNLLNYIPNLTEAPAEIPFELQMIVNEFLDWKGEEYAKTRRLKESEVHSELGAPGQGGTEEASDKEEQVDGGKEVPVSTV